MHSLTMRMVAELFRRIWYLLNRCRNERELKQELEAHCEAMTEPRDFGSSLRLREEVADVWAWAWWDHLRSDLTQARRISCRHPGFTIVAVGTLALGIGVNTAVFSLIDAVLLRPLPYSDPDRLVMIWEQASPGNLSPTAVAPGDYRDWRQSNRGFDRLAALDWRSFDLVGETEPEKISGYAVAEDFFSVLGVEPALGRAFLPEELQEGASSVVVISHSFWLSRFGGDPEALGSSLLLNNEPHIVMGVMPEGFQFLESYIDLWTPLVMNSEEASRRDVQYLQVVGRLKVNVSPETARTDLDRILGLSSQELPEHLRERTSQVIPLRTQLTGSYAGALVLLGLAVALALLVACANVGGMLLVRALSRRREFAMRMAIGAGNLRLSRQVLIEALFIALPGGIFGLFVAWCCGVVLSSLLPDSLAVSSPLQLDESTLAFALMTTVCAGSLCSLAPVVNLCGKGWGAALQKSGVGAADHSKRLQKALVIAEIAVATALAVCAGLLLQTWQNLHSQYSELRPSSILTLRTALSPERYWNSAKRNAFYDEVLSRVSALPGVLSAGYATSIPLERQDGAHEIFADGAMEEPPLRVNHRQVSDRYLQTMGVRLLQGRYLQPQDADDSQRVALVNRTMANRLWPGDDPIGKRFRLDASDGGRMVVGVVADIPQQTPEAPAEPEMYLPYRQIAARGYLAPRDLVVRSAGNPLDLTAAVKTAIGEVDAEQPAELVRTMEEVLSESTAPRRVQGLLLTSLAALALLLATLGVYTVVAYSVASQRVEIGVRMALGAQPRRVLINVLRQGMILAAAGTTLGLTVSAVLMQSLSSLVFGLPLLDLRTYGIVAALVMAVVLAACTVPAWRAAALNPATALRQ